MRFIIYGAGGIGGGIGGSLHRNGHDVALIARGTQLEAFQSTGLTLHTPDFRETFQILSYGHPSEIDFTDDDVVLLTMKSQHTAAALDDLAAAAGTEIPVFCAQNGVANERMALRRFTRVYGTVVYMPATYTVPGQVVVHASPGLGVLDSGRYPRGIDEVVEEVTAALTASAFRAEPDSDIMRKKYAKLLTNLGNVLLVACGPGSDTSELQSAVHAEALACYEAAGIESEPIEAMAAMRAGVIERSAIEGVPRQGSSSWQSILRGTGNVEADFLNGEIALLGAEHGVPAPVNRVVQRLANAAARGKHKPGSLTPEQVLALAAEGGP
ncbi:MAG: 2-dehydropantoate 2-reductase N-terminal domain-containing protein [Dehalococcoidia bacterium]|jgi:2-dehydropantoate 2-reductase|nr:2-dehydropantoate 2-reductase N-terminal domain-containing protein [Dehalococcoidia bacterium]